MRTLSFGQYATDYEERIDFNRLRTYRLDRSKEALKKSKLGSLICFDPYNIRYITSTHGPMWTALDKMCRYAVLPKDSEPTLFEIGSLAAARRESDAVTWMSPDRIKQAIGWGRGSLPNVEQAADRAVKSIKEVLRDEGVADLPVGVDVVDIPFLKALKDNDLEFADGQQVMLEAREIKSKDEIELLKLAAMIVDATYYELTKAIKPGIRECDLVGLVHRICFSMGADSVESVNAISGPRTNPHHHDFSDRVLRPNELVFFDICTSYMGYKTCYYRTFSIGKANREMKDLYRQCYDWLYDSIKAVKPGNTTADVAEKWPGPEALGFKTEAEVIANQWGHGLGLGLWERPIVSRAFSFENPYPFKKNMCFALETYAGPKGSKYGVRIEEELIVSEMGYEIITKYPCEELIECPVTP